VVGVRVGIGVKVVIGVVARSVARLAQLGPVELCIREVPSGSFEDVGELVRLILWVVRLHGEEVTRENLPIIPVKALEELGVTVIV